ncbi:Hypothetical protein D9617_23g004820 [Elsinoe fawcettii]|nr:Hypothetical protein D9617_23g004820 [Elsinoe fawcettii]
MDVAEDPNIEAAIKAAEDALLAKDDAADEAMELTAEVADEAAKVADEVPELVDVDESDEDTPVMEVIADPAAAGMVELAEHGH